MHKKYGRLLMVLGLLVGCSSESGMPPGDSEGLAGTDALPLSGAGYDPEDSAGEVVDKYWQASDTDHRAGVRIAFTNNTLCSGFLINDQTIVTAGHCVSAFAAVGKKNGSFSITLSIDEPGTAFRSLGTFNADFWFNGSTTTTGDIAVIRTDTYIGGGIDTDNFVLIPQSQQTISGTNWSFGYGFGSPTSTALNNQRMAVNTVGSVFSLYYVVSGGTGLACNGDSGGPALVGTNSAWDLVFGIHSNSTPRDPLGICAADGTASQFKANLATGSTFVALVLNNDPDNDFKCANWTTPAGQFSMWCWQLK